MSQKRPGGGTEGPSPIHIYLWIRAGEPLAGEMAVDGGVPASFEGWLDLLARLSEVVGTAPAD